MFEPEVFRKQWYTVLKKALATLLGLFGAREIVPLLPPLRYAPAREGHQ